MKTFKELFIEESKNDISGYETITGADRFERGNDFIYVKDKDFFFKDEDGDMIQIKNKGYLEDILKKYPKYKK
jgi:hypothetical protein